MSDPQAEAFSSGGIFAANPHLYDYVHTLKFESAGSFEMVDGAGQQLTALVRGRFTVEHTGPSESLVHLADLMEIDPYYKLKRFRGLELDAFAKAIRGDVSLEEQDVLGRVDPFDVRVIREAGPFLLRRQVVWKISDPDEWPYLLYPERYRFEVDPLARFAANRAASLYHKLERPVMDEHIYYWRQDAQNLTAREVTERGMTFDAVEA